MTDSDLVYVWCKWKYVEDLQYHLKLAQTLVLLLDFLQILRKFFFYSGGGHPGGCLAGTRICEVQLFFVIKSCSQQKKIALQLFTFM